jgi:hypothetical protein
MTEPTDRPRRATLHYRLGVQTVDIPVTIVGESSIGYRVKIESSIHLQGAPAPGSTHYVLKSSKTVTLTED